MIFIMKPITIAMNSLTIITINTIHDNNKNNEVNYTATSGTRYYD